MKRRDSDRLTNKYRFPAARVALRLAICGQFSDLDVHSTFDWPATSNKSLNGEYSTKIIHRRSLFLRSSFDLRAVHQPWNRFTYSPCRPSAPENPLLSTGNAKLQFHRPSFVAKTRESSPWTEQDRTRRTRRTR